MSFLVVLVVKFHLLPGTLCFVIFLKKRRFAINFFSAAECSCAWRSTAFIVSNQYDRQILLLCYMSISGMWKQHGSSSSDHINQKQKIWMRDFFCVVWQHGILSPLLGDIHAAVTKGIFSMGVIFAATVPLPQCYCTANLESHIET